MKFELPKLLCTDALAPVISEKLLILTTPSNLH